MKDRTLFFRLIGQRVDLISEMAYSKSESEMKC